MSLVARSLPQLIVSESDTVEGATAWAVWFAPDSRFGMSRVSHGCESNGSLSLRILKGELGKFPAACW